jgi:hypothetical protein
MDITCSHNSVDVANTDGPVVGKEITISRIVIVVTNTTVVLLD